MRAAHKHNVLLAIGFVLLWNSGFIGADYGLPYTNPYTLMFFRYAGVAIVMMIYLTVMKRFIIPSWAAGWRSMVIGALAHGMWLLCVMISLENGVPPGIVALVVALQPLTTGAFSGIATGEHTSKQVWIGLIIGFIGVALSVVYRVDFSKTQSIINYFILLVSVGSITVASLMQRSIELKRPKLQLPIDASLFYQSIGTMLLVGLPAIFAERFYVEWNLEFNLTLIWLIIAVSIGAYTFMWSLIQRIDATRVSSLFYLGPPVTMLMDWAAFGTIPNPMDFIGLTVVFTGVFITYMPNPKKKKKNAVRVSTASQTE